jgi:hypothetical protein
MNRRRFIAGMLSLPAASLAAHVVPENLKKGLTAAEIREDHEEPYFTEEHQKFLPIDIPFDESLWQKANPHLAVYIQAKYLGKQGY